MPLDLAEFRTCEYCKHYTGTHCRKHVKRNRVYERCQFWEPAFHERTLKEVEPISDPFKEFPRLKANIGEMFIYRQGDIDKWREKWQLVIEEWRENTLRLEAIARGENPCLVCPHLENGGCPRAECIFAQIWKWRKYHFESLEAAG